MDSNIAIAGKTLTDKEKSMISINEQNAKYLKENPLSTIVPAPGSPEISRAYREGVYIIQDRLCEIAKKPIAGFGESKYANDFPLKHSFAEGVYQRELFMPAGLFLVSHLHRDSYFSWLIKGALTMFTEEGGQRLKAPMLMTSPLGCKRILYAHTDSVWITVHPNPTNSTDIELLESQIHVLEGGYEVLEDKIIDVGEIKDLKKIDKDEIFENFMRNCITG